MKKFYRILFAEGNRGLLSLGEALLAFFILYILHSYLQAISEPILDSFLESSSSSSSSTTSSNTRGVLDMDFKENFLRMLQDFILYASVYGGVGWFLLFRVFPFTPASPRIFPKHFHPSICIGIGCIAGAILFMIVSFLSRYINIENGEIKEGSTKFLADSLQSGLDMVLLHLVFTAALTGIIEELFYRGYLQNYLEGKCGAVLSICVSASIFAFAHPHAPNILILSGLVFSVLYWLFGLASSIMAHIFYNGLILLYTAFFIQT